MPKAVVQTEAITYNLKSCPGGWVQLRPLTFGQLLKRREMASRMSTVSSNDTKAPDRFLMEIIVLQTNLFDFKHCIVDHNLFVDDEETTKFNFADPKAFERLDPRIGTEIETEISKLNEPETEEELANFTRQSLENSDGSQTAEQPILNDGKP